MGCWCEVATSQWKAVPWRHMHWKVGEGVSKIGRSGNSEGCENSLSVKTDGQVHPKLRYFVPVRYLDLLKACFSDAVFSFI